MKIRVLLFLLSIFTFILFTCFSYTVAKESWTQVDFDTTVKLQDRIPVKFDKYFSYFSLIGSAEITIGLCLVMMGLALLKLRWFQVLGWLMIVPVSIIEIFGKLVLFHPAPAHFLHRTSVFTHLPSFYIHTDFSYPSGHMTRTLFIVTIFLVILIFQKNNLLSKFLGSLVLLSLAFLMGLTRVSLGEHWTSDVVGGVLLGIGGGFFASGLILNPKKG